MFTHMLRLITTVSSICIAFEMDHETASCDYTILTPHTI